MIALQGYLPESDPARPDVAEVLKDNPDIRAMVEKISGHAASYFGWMTLSDVHFAELLRTAQVSSEWVLSRLDELRKERPSE